jgi:hypothetical protein
MYDAVVALRAGASVQVPLDEAECESAFSMDMRHNSLSNKEILLSSPAARAA